MDNKKTEALIDQLLVLMNKDIEELGDPIKQVYFSFLKGEDDYVNAKSQLSVDDDGLMKILKICVSRGYVTNVYGNPLQAVRLSEEGQARAISVMNADSSKVATAGDIHIGTIHTNAPTQIGNYNKQDIQQFFQHLEKQIDQSSGSNKEKQEAKNRLQSFLEHPLTQTAIGTVTTVGMAMAGK